MKLFNKQEIKMKKNGVQMYELDELVHTIYLRLAMLILSWGTGSLKSLLFCPQLLRHIQKCTKSVVIFNLHDWQRRNANTPPLDPQASIINISTSKSVRGSSSHPPA